MFARRFSTVFIAFSVGVFAAILFSSGCSHHQPNPQDAYKPIATTPEGPIMPATIVDSSYAMPVQVALDAETTVPAGTTEPAGTAESAYATNWPITIDAPEGRIEVYQPQPDSLIGDQLKARAAVALTKTGATEPVFGAIWLTARIVTDRDTRTVTLTDITIREARLRDATPEENKEFAAAIAARLPQQVISFPLDQFMTSLELAQREKIEKQEFSNTPPKVLISTVPATLITIHGPPALRPMAGVTGVRRVVNTPFILLFDNEQKRYYLKAGSRWVTAADIQGPWESTKEVPAPIAAAGAALAHPTTQPTTGAGTQPTSAAGAADLAESAADARIIVATEPTELIVTDGDPKFAPLPGTQVFYCTNTKSHLFLDPSSRQYYVLLSGRWFTAPSLQGPWTYVPADKLPPAFKDIPADSPKADVLPFVAGTTQAHEAVLDAGIPQTAAIRRDAGKDLNVPYDGQPKFEPIQGTSMNYAVNSPASVVQVNDGYYCCHQGVWYDSDAPTGPWAVCVTVPPEIYAIPPSCPLYNITYVHVYDFYPDVVYVGYLPGYLESFVYGPTVVYCTGYDYPGYLGVEFIAPPCTYGFGAYYDPWVCDWGFGFGYFWGVDWFIDFDYHHDHDHMWGWHHWWGPRGFVHYRQLQAVHAAGVAGGIHEANWRSHVASHFHNIYQRPYNAHRIARPSGIPPLEHGRGEAARVAAARAEPARAEAARREQARAVAGRSDNNVFVGHNGDIYRRTETGWEERHANAWRSIERVPEARPSFHPVPAPAYHPYLSPSAGMERSYLLRSRGVERSSVFHGGVGGPHGGVPLRGVERR